MVKGQRPTVPATIKGAQRKGTNTGSKGVTNSFLTPAAAGRGGGGSVAAVRVPGCCACGQLITDTVKALQCDCCQSNEVWKCSDCLGLRGDLYDALMSEAGSCLKWLCDGCEAVMARRKEPHNAESSDRMDTMLALMQRLLDRFDIIDAHLDGKTDVTVTSQLEIRLRTVEERAMQLEERLLKTEEKLARTVEERAIQLEERLLKTEEKLASTEEKWTNKESELVQQQRGEEGLIRAQEAGRKIEEEKDIESRKGNIIIYRVPEDRKLKPEERKKTDRAYVQEMCQEVFSISIGAEEDIIKQFRLGALPEDDRPRPLLVSFKDACKKEAIMGNLKKLKLNEGKFNEVSIAHDLTPRQRKAVHDLLEEARKEQPVGNGDEKENYKFIVVGANNRPRVIKVRKQQ